MRAEEEDEEEQQQQSRVFYELCYKIGNILKPMIPDPHLATGTSSSRRKKASPAALASIFLGIWLALMLFGSITFVIGFVLMPWILGLVFLFYVAGFVSNLSELGRSFFSSTDVPAAWNFSRS